MTSLRRRSVVRLAMVCLLLATAGVLPGLTAQAAIAVPGEFVFVQSPDRQSYYLYAANARTGSRRRISVKRAVGRPSFSPGGSAVVFSGPVGNDDTLGRYGLYIVHRDGSGLRRVGTPAVAHLDPAWSPSRLDIAFTLDSRGNSEASCCSIALIRASGRWLRKVPNTSSGSFPSWSPDSKTLAFVRPDGLYVISRYGVGRRRIATGTITTPKWSPDGTRIAYAQRTGETVSVLRVVSRSGGTPTTRWAPRASHVESPVWAPNGKTLYAIAHQGWGDWARRSSSVWVVPPSGTPTKQIDPSSQMFFLDYHSQPR